MPTHSLRNPRVLGQVQGAANVAGGLWPLMSIRTFEWIFGRKTDRWLVYTVSGLLVANGISQWKASRAGEWRAARNIGIGTAVTLGAIDAVYAPIGRIRWTYLLDGAVEVGWVALWLMADDIDDGHAATRPSGLSARSAR